MSAAFIVVVLGFSFGWIARELWTVKEEQRAIAKALFARIPMREPYRTEILRLAKESTDWSREGENAASFPQAAMMNTVAEERARERLLDAQREP